MKSKHEKRKNIMAEYAIRYGNKIRNNLVREENSINETGCT